MIKCEWTPQISMIERKINVYKIAEQRQSMYEKLVTFEGPMHLSKFGMPAATAENDNPPSS